MTHRHVLTLTVEFGDCDPSGIAFHPNFFRWFDAASLHYFRSLGLPPWRELTPVNGILGTPVVSTHCDFKLPCRYGDVVEVHTEIEEWREKSFVMRHVLKRGDTVLAEGRGVRVFAVQHPEDPQRVKAVPAPAEIRALCERQ